MRKRKGCQRLFWRYGEITVVLTIERQLMLRALYNILTSNELTSKYLAMVHDYNFRSFSIDSDLVIL